MKAWPCLFAALVLMATSAIAQPTRAPLPGESVYRLPIQLIDQNGKEFAWADHRGKVRIVSMFYMSCPYICPLIIDSGKAVERQLTPAQLQQVGIVLISMDPKRDTPIALKSVATKRKLDPARWTLASPAPGAVRSIAAVLGIRYRALADGEFNHSSALILLDAEGRVLARTEKVGSQPDPEFLAAVKRVTSASAIAPTRPSQ